ncbi:hypothetical protein MMC25_008065 [Agyrium rufum]|nr:hypothetical protein [Agyrium rufum]
MSYHPDRREQRNGPIAGVIRQLRFLVEANWESLDITSRYSFKPTLLNFLTQTRLAEATDPRDKVYGIFSLAEDAKKLGYQETDSKWIPFKVDYQLTKDRVFINVTKAILYTSHSLYVLQFARKRTGQAGCLPSWVPDWASEDPYLESGDPPLAPLHGLARESWRDKERNLSLDTFPSGSSLHENITYFCDASFYLSKNDTLNIKGIHCDTIKSLSDHPWRLRDDRWQFNPQSIDPDMEKEFLEEMESELNAVQE